MLPADFGLALTGIAAAAHDERGVDCYSTPPEAVHALLAAESFTGVIWEPACGPGAIVDVLRLAGHRVVATDLESYGCPDSLAGVDFLAQTTPPKNAETIITNPPFMLAGEFARHALELVPKVVMLLRLAFLEGVRRGDVLDGGALARVHVFRNRLPMMHRAGWDGPTARNAMAFAWFVWDRDHRGPTKLTRISHVPAPTAPDQTSSSS
jgi:hypothetical protein